MEQPLTGTPYLERANSVLISNQFINTHVEHMIKMTYPKSGEISTIILFKNNKI